MAIQGVDTKCYILALFVRDDGERFLLGSGHYEFKDTQMHFAANAIQNDIVEVQGNDGFLLAGQVRRPGTQSFDGYVGDGTLSKQDTEAYRRQFFSFFRKNFFYKVIYVFSDGTAIQRKRGFLVDDPTVQELYQIYPEYHVALNFEDVNYYSYSEDDEGHEQYAKEATIDLSSMRATGGLEWDNLGVIWENPWSGEQTASGTEITIQNDMSVMSPTKDTMLYGNTFQQTYSGKNLFNKDATPFVKTSNTEITIMETGIRVSQNTATTSNMYATYIIGNFSSFADQVITLSADMTISGQNTSRLALGYCKADGSSRTTKTTLNTSGQVSLRLSATELAERPYLYIYAYANTSGGEGQAGDYVEYTHFQLELNSTATSYEPYTGGIPAPNPDYPQDIHTVTGEQTVEVSGENQWGNISQYGKSTNGINFVTNQDGTISATGTATANAYSVLTSAAVSAGVYVTLSAGTYTLSEKNNNTVQAYEAVAGSQVLADTSTSTVTFTLTETKNIVVRAVVRNGQEISGTQIFYPMLEQGSTATTYEPYQSQSYEINLGKNLFDKDNANILVSYFDSSVTTITADSRNRTIFIPCLSNTTYTVSKLASPSRRSIGYTEAIPTDGVQVYGLTDIPVNGTTGTITTGASAKYLVVRLWSSSQDTSTSLEQMLGSVQIEQGSTATSYAPYFTPIELCKLGTYQDYIYKSGDDWFVHKEVQHLSLGISDMDNSEQYPGWRNRTVLVDTLGSGLNNSLDRITPYLANILSSDSGSADTGGLSANTRGTGSLFFQNGNWSQTYWKTNYSNLSLELYYGILVPQVDTQITDQTLVGQLNALGRMRLFVGENNLIVVATGTNLPSPISFKYYTIAALTGAVWEEGGSGGATVVEVDSITNIYPIWKVKGPAVNPELSVISTNTTIQYNGTITGTQTLEVDMFNKTAKLNGVSVIGNISGDWINFSPGTNRVIYTADNADALPSTIEWQEVVG